MLKHTGWKEQQCTSHLVRSMHDCPWPEQKPWNDILLPCCQDSKHIGSMLCHFCVKVLCQCTRDAFLESVYGTPTGNNMLEMMDRCPSTHDFGHRKATMHAHACVYAGRFVDHFFPSRATGNWTVSAKTLVCEKVSTHLCIPLRSDTPYT